MPLFSIKMRQRPWNELTAIYNKRNYNLKNKIQAYHQPYDVGHEERNGLWSKMANQQEHDWLGEIRNDASNILLKTK